MFDCEIDEEHYIYEYSLFVCLNTININYSICCCFYINYIKYAMEAEETFDAIIKILNRNTIGTQKAYFNRWFAIFCVCAFLLMYCL